MTTPTEKFVTSFRRAICDQIEIAAYGFGKYQVHLPFTFDDGDHYLVALTKEGDRWVLTDEGNTFMHLAYKLPQFDEGKRRDIIEDVLRSHNIQNDQGSLRLMLNQEDPGDGLFSFVQAISKITDVSFLSREVVKTTFWEDFEAVTKANAGNRSVAFTYYHPVRDKGRLYPVNARIEPLNGHPQVFVFGMSTEEQCQRHTITLYKWREWKEPFRSVGIFRDQPSLASQDVARFTDVVDKSFSNIETAREHLPEFLAGYLAR